MSPAPALPRLLAGLRPDGMPVTLAEHLRLHGPLPPAAGRRRPDTALIDLVARAGLRGRGGAAFPTARKLEAVVRSRGPAIVVANGSEGEPLSAKDRALLTRVPHLVLDGATLAGRAVGAAEVIVAVGGRAPGLLAAVGERARAGLDEPLPRVVTVPERFLAGEETALASFLSGGPGLPTVVPPRPAERGVRGRPTLVDNVETLAHLALIARHGPEWFRSVGTPGEPGSTLLTLQGALARPGVYEVARGARLGDVVEAAGGATSGLQAFLLGGYAGAWLPAEAVGDVPLSEEGLRPHGGILGAGIVLAFPAGACGILETSRIASYLARQGAGQCGPCVHGLAAIAGGLEDLARGRAPGDIVVRLQSWAWQVTGRGACHHPDGAARLAVSALEVFAADVAAHLRHRPCPGAGRAMAGAGARPR